MPSSKNTSSKGAPNRNATRLDRIPASTRTLPSRIAMLKVSSAAMGRVGLLEAGAGRRDARTLLRISDLFLPAQN